MTHIVGFTGTQSGMTKQQAASCRGLLNYGGVRVIHHGDCIGADAEFHHLFIKLRNTGDTYLRDGKVVHGWDGEIVIHPPNHAGKRAFCTAPKTFKLTELPSKPYLERNEDIVAESDWLIACPKESEETLRSGTWATIRDARNLKVNYWLVLPSGVIKFNG